MPYEMAGGAGARKQGSHCCSFGKRCSRLPRDNGYWSDGGE
jgi:hypothetical protein